MTAVLYQVASIWPFYVFTAASTIVMLCGLTQQTCSNVTHTHTHIYIYIYIYVLLLMPSRNSLFIMIAVLPLYYAVCQPLQLSPCQEVHPQAATKLPLQPSNGELLCLPPLILVSSMGLSHPHKWVQLNVYWQLKQCLRCSQIIKERYLYSHHTRLHSKCM
jgi:hypothetical protein